VRSDAPRRWPPAGSSRFGTRLASHTLSRVIAVVVVASAIVLLLGHDAIGSGALLVGGRQAVTGVVTSFVIGVSPRCWGSPTASC
jgi:hypothetical protein